jgi:exopolysaccharide production protein ExoZ
MAAMEGLRGYAVALTFLVHFTWFISMFSAGLDLNKVKPTEIENPFLFIGYYLFRSHYGVDIFFALSGYLIARMVVKADFEYPRFLFWRIVRIYPVYLVALSIYEARTGALHARNFIANVLLLNGFPELRIRSIYVPSWSLTYEMTFYVVFPLVFLALRRAPIERLLLLAGGFALLSFMAADDYIRFEMFLIGAVMARCESDTLARLTARMSDGAVLAVYVLAAGTFVFVRDYRVFFAMFALPSACLIIKALFGTGTIHRVFSWGPLRYLGRVSYSFYLLHELALAPALVRPLEPMWWPLAFGLTFLGTVLLSTISFVLLERPYYVLMVRWRPMPARESGERARSTAADMGQHGVEDFSARPAIRH